MIVIICSLLGSIIIGCWLQFTKEIVSISIKKISKAIPKQKISKNSTLNSASDIQPEKSRNNLSTDTKEKIKELVIQNG